MEITGKSAVVTGGASGVGRSLCLGLAERGAAGVVVCDIDAEGAAKVAAADAARLVTRTGIQCHGAMGYTTEYELHLFAKRAWALIPGWGSPDWHRARLASALGVCP